MRTRVMLWGTAGAVLPFLLLGSFVVYRGMEFIELPFWLWMGAIFAIFLLPLSFAYAVVKHRVMEIPVLLRRSAQYVVVRHSIVIVGIVIGVALTFAFAALFSRVLSDGPERRALSGVAGAMFGVLVTVATRSGVSQVTQRLDRAFFREAYDARQLLQNLARRNATLLFAVYDERTARIQYANCGHLPPVLLRSSGSIERLPPTASVIGLFDEWNCSTRDVELTAGDTLVMFTDGVVEAFNAEQEEGRGGATRQPVARADRTAR